MIQNAQHHAKDMGRRIPNADADTAAPSNEGRRFAEGARQACFQRVLGSSRTTLQSRGSQAGAEQRIHAQERRLHARERGIHARSTDFMPGAHDSCPEHRIEHGNHAPGT